MAKDSILDIKDILNDYSDDIQESIIKCAESVAKKGADKLKTSSPKRTGRYRKGWRTRTIKSKGEVESVIYIRHPGASPPPAAPRRQCCRQNPRHRASQG